MSLQHEVEVNAAIAAAAVRAEKELRGLKAAIGAALSPGGMASDAVTLQLTKTQLAMILSMTDRMLE